MASIQIDRVSKVFEPETPPAVDKLSLDIADGEFLVLVGPSGCGKSTLLRMIAGLETPSDGVIRIDGHDVTGAEPRDRDIAMVFQNYALYPQMTVQENLGFGLRMRKTPKPEMAEQVDRVGRVLGLDELMQRRPGALSGGQRQRVAMGRAMARRPKAYLMDEPLSNLDARLRVSMRAELARLHERLGTTTVYVTHDQVEAMTLGHRVAVMRDGLLQQCDSPRELFRGPRNVFVASFMGSPPMNLVKAELDGSTLTFGDAALPLGDRAAAVAGRSELILGIRPTDLLDAESADATLPRLRARIKMVEELGTETYILFSCGAERFSIDPTVDPMNDEDEGRLLADDTEAILTARLDGWRSAVTGQALELAVDPRAIHLFDLETGEALRAGDP